MTRPGAARTSDRRSLIVALAVITIVVEVLGNLSLLPGLPIGSFRINATVLPGLVLAIACGDRLAGRSSNRARAAVFWASATGVLLALGITYFRHGRSDLWTGLVTAALGEELVYRLAIPLVAAIVLRRLGMAAHRARPLGFAIAAVWFVALPGHLDQVDSAVGLLPFAAFAALSAIVVYRSGSVLPMAIAHAVTNLLTVLLWADATSTHERALGLVVVLGLLIAAYGEHRRWTIGDEGELIDTTTGLEVAVIDLRDGRPVSVTLSDGTVLSGDRVGVLPDSANPAPAVPVRLGAPATDGVGAASEDVGAP